MAVKCRTVVHFKREDGIEKPQARRMLSFASLESIAAEHEEAAALIELARGPPIPITEKVEEVGEIHSPQPLQLLLPNRIDTDGCKIVERIDMISFYEEITHLSPQPSIAPDQFHLQNLMHACKLVITDMCQEAFEEALGPGIPDWRVRVLALMVDSCLFGHGRRRVWGWDSAAIIKAWATQYNEHLMRKIRLAWPLNVKYDLAMIHEHIITTCSLGFRNQDTARKFIAKAIHDMLFSQ